MKAPFSGNEPVKQESPTNSKSWHAKDLAHTFEQSKVRLEIPAVASGISSTADDLIPDTARDSVNELTASSVAYKRLRDGGLVERPA